jgi:hypothetical protein
MFPHHLADYKGKIDASEISRYPEITKYIHTVEINNNSMRRYELI